MDKISIIGVGNMGAPMSVNLANAGFQVRAFDLVAEKVQRVSKFGVKATGSHEEAVINADLILTMLPTGVEVRDVLLNHVFDNADPGTRIVDCSTIDLSDARELHRYAEARGIEMLDAPVSGGTIGARNAALTFMVGGNLTTLDTTRSVFQSMGSKIIHCGEAGMGQAAKMCNNLMLGIQMASVTEGFKLAKQVGLDDEKLFEVSTNSSGNCFALTTFCPIQGLVATAPSSNDFQPGFSTDLMLKDMKLALSAASGADLSLDVAPIAASIYQQFSDQGNGGKDFSAIYTMLPKV